MSLSPEPSSDQLALMSNSWQQTGITQGNTAGVIGMYSKNDVYTFYMFFKANDSDAWWEVASVTDDTCTTAGIKNFRVMFQMGDDDS